MLAMTSSGSQSRGQKAAGGAAATHRCVNCGCTIMPSDAAVEEVASSLGGGVGFRVKDSGFKGPRLKTSGFGFWGLRFIKGLGFGVWGFGFWELG
jgi:hypothetical protein